MNRFELSGSPTIAGDRSVFGFCRRMRSKSGMPLSPHQVSFQSRLLGESHSLILLERVEFFDEDEVELIVGPEV